MRLGRSTSRKSTRTSWTVLTPQFYGVLQNRTADACWLSFRTRFKEKLLSSKKNFFCVIDRAISSFRCSPTLASVRHPGPAGLQRVPLAAPQQAQAQRRIRKLGLLWLLIQNGTLRNGSLLLWDEPETNLNPKLFGILMDVLLELQRSGVQVLLAEGIRKLGLLWLDTERYIAQWVALLWDEPETNLNPKLFGILMDVLLELQRWRSGVARHA